MVDKIRNNVKMLYCLKL